MNNREIVESFNNLKDQKYIDRPTLMTIIESVFIRALKKQFGQEADFNIIMNPNNGDVEIWRNFTIVDDLELKESKNEIQLSKAREIEADFELGEEYSVSLEIKELNRRNILSLRQDLNHKITEFLNKSKIEYFKNFRGELYSASVYLIKKDAVVLLDNDSNEILLPRDKQIPGDFFNKGDVVMGVIESVNLISERVVITMSRKSNNFLEKLMQSEISEIGDGTIVIKKVERVPGSRAKVIVESYCERTDPVGACVGHRGSKINSIVKELNGEYIDIINWTENKKLLITRALNPANILSVDIDHLNNWAFVNMEDDQINRAIGRYGLNIKLASLITGFKININRDREDIQISEFNDEIDQWIIDEFVKVGLITAKSILRKTPSYLEEATDLEEETIKSVIKILKSEFNEDISNTAQY
jgi:N utilization substance protein A